MESGVHVQLPSGGMKDTADTIIDLLVDLDILCKKLELLDHETLIFCTASDNVITSSIATLFFKPVDRVFANFKQFCETQKSTSKASILPQERMVVEDTYATETVIPETIVAGTEGVNVTDGQVVANEPSMAEGDEYGGDTDDDYEDLFENTWKGTDTHVHVTEIKVEKNGTKMEIVSIVEKKNEAVTDEANENAKVYTSPKKKRYLKENRAESGIQKLDGTDYFTEKKEMLPDVSNKKGRNTPQSKGKTYMEINDERLLLMMPEETGLDFSKGDLENVKCFKCRKVAPSLSRLREHLTKVHKIKIGYQCVCGRYFPDNASYDKHKYNKTYYVYHHECKVCKEVFPSAVALKSHAVLEHGDSKEEILLNQAEKFGDFPCLRCETTFHHEQHLLDHNEYLPNCDEALKEENSDDKNMQASELRYENENKQLVITTIGEIVQNCNEEPFKCPCCKASFTKKTNLQRHLLRHLSSGTHLCLICGNKFKGRDGLQRHMNQHMIKPYNCPNCRSRFGSEQELSLHIISRCKEGSREDFKCDLCDYLAVNVSALQAHQNMHAGIKPFKCNKCDSCFATKSSLDRHDTVRHNDATPFTCEKCGKKFKTKDNMNKHAKVHEAPKYSCEICGKACTEKGNLNKHMRTHTNEKPYICELCGKAYGRKSLLENHRRLHTGEKPYSCSHDGCDKSFRSYSNLKQHIRNHSTTHPYVCDICGKMFKQPGRMNHHRKDHTIAWRWPCAYCDSKFKSIFMYKSHLAKVHPDMRKDIEEKANIKLYECDQCHKVYGDKDDLTRHIYIHENIKPFECQYCSKKFNDKSNMRQHEKIHTGEKHHFCEVCKKGFIHKRDLRSHIQTNHSKDEDGNYQTQRERRAARKKQLLFESLEQEFSNECDTKPAIQDGIDMSLIPQSYQGEVSQKPVETVIEEQPRDLTMAANFQHYISTHSDMPIFNLPVAAVNPATGQIEPLMIIENYQ